MERGDLESMLSRGLSLAEIGPRFDRHESTVATGLENMGFTLRVVRFTGLGAR